MYLLIPVSSLTRNVLLITKTCGERWKMGKTWLSLFTVNQKSTSEIQVYMLHNLKKDLHILKHVSYVEIFYHLHSTNNWLIFADFTSLFYESCLFLNINHFLNFPIVLLNICIEINNSVNTNQLTVWCASNKRL